jgi:hypothetical protein
MTRPRIRKDKFDGATLNRPKSFAKKVHQKLKRGKLKSESEKLELIRKLKRRKLKI